MTRSVVLGLVSKRVLSLAGIWHCYAVFLRKIKAAKDFCAKMNRVKFKFLAAFSVPSTTVVVSTNTHRRSDVRPGGGLYWPHGNDYTNAVHIVWPEIGK
ncbi:hypothetical protein B0H12DRAFT_26911 [Mycena haematopus]|nr:hypothetical protein B0H12DRAFT_26911 [Mycena haematopus]